MKEDELLPARMLNEFAYCPRLFHLEYVQGQFEDSADTLEGDLAHRRLEAESGALPPSVGPEEIHARSVMLSSMKWGIISRIDLIESRGSGVVPVEYKRGRAPDVEVGAWEPEQVQLCAQGMILRDNGYSCDEGVVYYAQSNKRVSVPFTKSLVERTSALIDSARKAAQLYSVPPPLVDSPKCPRCSLVRICLPDESNLLGGTEDSRQEVRRLYPARPDSLPVYVQEQGAVVGKSGERLTIKKDRRLIEEVRLIDVSQLCIFGNALVTSNAIQSLCERGIPICHFTHGGWFYAMTSGMPSKNVLLRALQFKATDDRSRALQASRAFVEGKIKNSRTMLRRNHRLVPARALLELSKLCKLASEARSTETLLGIEGAAAQVYFANFVGMLKPKEASFAFDFTSRNRRPPTDPVNALLSFVYALLAKDVTVAALGVGFDPFLGFYHSPRYGRPSLALDLMEEFRPLVADSVVLSMINSAEVGEQDFLVRGGSVALTTAGRRKTIEAYHRRLDSLVTHPIFGYSISYARVIEVQSRLLGRWLWGEIPRYPPFCTR